LRGEIRVKSSNVKEKKRKEKKRKEKLHTGWTLLPILVGSWNSCLPRMQSLEHGKGLQEL
jgi:hypothetical protein